MCVCVYVCIYMYMYDRKEERERERDSETNFIPLNCLGSSWILSRKLLQSFATAPLRIIFYIENTDVILFCRMRKLLTAALRESCYSWLKEACERGRCVVHWLILPSLGIWANWDRLVKLKIRGNMVLITTCIALISWIFLDYLC